MKRSYRTMMSRKAILASLLLCGSLAVVGAHHLAQQPAQEGTVWNVNLAPGAQANSTITIENQCQRTHTFTVIKQQELAYLQMPGTPNVAVPGNSSYEYPVRFNTTGMAVGEYQGTIEVKCETCRKEKICKQDREIIPLHLTISQASATPTATGTAASPTPLPGPTISGDNTTGLTSGNGRPPILATAIPKATPYDSKLNALSDEREFPDPANQNYVICETGGKKCEKPIELTFTTGEKTGKIGCKEDQCEDCEYEGAKCVLFVASSEKANTKDKDVTNRRKWVRESGGRTPSDKEVYRCQCIADTPATKKKKK